MKRLLASMVLIAATSALAGCYYDPGYSYVRSAGYGGDAYYGSGSTYYVAPDYYSGYYPGYYPNYYGGYGGYYGPDVSIGIGGTLYGGSRYYRHRAYSRSHDQAYRGRGSYRGGSHPPYRGGSHPSYRGGNHGPYRGGTHPTYRGGGHQGSSGHSHSHRGGDRSRGDHDHGH